MEESLAQKPDAGNETGTGWKGVSQANKTSWKAFLDISEQRVNFRDRESD